MRMRGCRSISATRSQNGCARSCLNFPYWSGDHSMSQDLSDLADDLHRVLAVRLRHIEQDLQREVVEEDPRSHQQRGHRRHVGAKLRANLLQPAAGEHLRVTLAHFTVKLLDVRAVE